ncbi:hypothetical protein AB0Q95_12630 [Streptomyces sp. NPDC059900]|uniref:hypothetical protein n=1 Tax=Streptomyces sp. NPDC059900 TaxID=3155816 RepID=UPI003424A2FC
MVHPPSGTGGRRVTAHGRILGLAHSDADVIGFLRLAGLPDAEGLLDDPARVKWRGGHAHRYGTA